VVPADQLDQEMEKICAAIKSKSRSVIQLGKKFFYEQLALDIKTAYEQGENVMVKNLSLPDGQEGIKSFVEKRKPKWQK
jgi:enoyl-CoA hydratase/carnithine racemase